MALSQNNESASRTVPPPDPAEAEQLYQQIIPEQGLEAKDTASRRTYHTFSMLRFRTPRVFRVFLVVVVAVLAVAALMFPVPVTSIDVDYAGGGKVNVQFTTGPLDFLDRVTAIFNGSSMPVSRSSGVYSLELTQNGKLVLTSESPMGFTDTKTINIDGIDDTPPHVVRHFREGDNIHIYLEDAGSGVDWDAVTVTDPDGQAVDFTLADPEEGCIIVPFPESSLYLSVPDNSGNGLSVVLNLK